MRFAREAFEFTDGVARLSTVDEVLDATVSVLGRYGFEAFSFYGLPRNDRPVADAVLVKRLPEELLKTYDHRRYGEIDPSLRRLRQTVEPYEWLDLSHECKRGTRAAELFGMIADFRLSQGLVVPVPSASGGRGAVWMAGSEPELTARIKPALHLMALYAFGRVQRLAAPRSSVARQLTLREREVLKWVAQGKRTWEISEILGISDRTVNEHVKAAGRKLGSANRTHAVALALHERIIEI